MPLIKKSRLSTGIPDLDLIMEGGYSNPANFILIGPSGNEKAAFAYAFAAAAEKDENPYILCGNSSPADIINKAGNMGIDLGSVHFIDCYSSTLGNSRPESTDRITIVPSPSALNDISLALNEAIAQSQGKKMRIVFDTLSTFVLYNSRDSMKKFLSVISGRLKNASATTLFLVDEGVHDKQLLSLIEHGMDDTYTLIDSGGKFELVIPDVDMPIPVRVGPGGIIII